MELKTDYGKWKVKEDFNVLSEFDGMSCGQIALNKTGKRVTNYFASEIEKKPKEVALNNFPNTKHLGDVTKIKISELPKIHLFIGGSPCQGFSFAGKQLNFNDPRSRLFFEFAADLRYIQEFINPDVKFLLENVRMKKEYKDVISRFLGVEPMEMNSSLVSAQNRKRLYWTNIENVTTPEDKGILLKDIIDYGEVDREKSLCITQRYCGYQGSQSYLRRRYFGKSMGQAVFSNNSIHLQKEAYKEAPYIEKQNIGEIRSLNRNECERLQNVPDNYTGKVSVLESKKMIGNGWTVDIIAHIFSFL